MDRPTHDYEALDDKALLARIAARDESAATVLYNRWFRQFYALAYRFVGRTEPAEDIAQEAFVRVLVKVHRYNPTLSARTWFATIVRRLAFDWLRRARVRAAVPLADPEDDGERALDVPDREPTALERVQAREREAAVRWALAQLPDDDRDVLLLRDYEGHSPAEAAAALDIPLGRVGGRLYRARQRFGDLLVREFPSLFPSRGR